MYFEPLAGEFGHYEIGVNLPGQPIPPSQTSFDIVGLGFGIEELSRRLIVGMPVTNHIELRNLTGVPLTDLSASVVGAPPNVIIQIEGPDSLAAYETNMLTCILQATGPTPAHSECQLQVTSAEGAVNGLPLTIDVTPPVPHLVATPASLQRTMVRGDQTFVEVQLANMGGASAHDVQVLIPSAPWLSLASAQRLVSLGVGETTIVTLALRPAPDLPLGSYPSFIRFHAVETDLDVPFEFRCVSVQQGDLLVVVTDESTYFAEGAPRVANATVTVTVGTNVVSAVTDAAGAVLFTNLTEDYYQVDVQADKHGPFSTTFLIEAGQPNRIEAFLSCETVSYDWIVVTNSETDEYDIDLVTTVDVAVPWPSLTIHPSDLNLCHYPVETQVNLTIINHGIIKAADLKLKFPSHPAWEIKPLTENLGELGAQTNIVVPVSIRRIGPGGNVPSSMYGRLDYTFLGDGVVFHRRTPHLVRNANVWDCVAHPQITLEPKTLDLCGFPGETNVTFTIRNTGTMNVEGTTLAFDSHRHWQIEPAVTNLGSLPAQTTRTVSVLFRKVPSSTSGASRIDGHLSCTATLEGETRPFTKWTRLHNPNPWDCVPSPLITIQPGDLDLCAFTSDTSVTFTLHNRGSIVAEALELTFPSSHPHWQIEPSQTSLGSLNPQETRQVPVLFRRIVSATDGPSPIAGRLDYRATVEGETRTFAPTIPLYRPNAWDCVPQPPVTIWPWYIDLCSLRALTNEIHFTIQNWSSFPTEGGRLVFDNSHPHWTFEPPLTDLGVLPPGATRDVMVRFIQTPTPTNGSRSLMGRLEYHTTVENQTRPFSRPIVADRANDSDCITPPPPPPPPDDDEPSSHDYTHVRGELLLHQKLTMTRNTFNATLNLTNNSATFPLTNVAVTIEILDASQQPAADRFAIRLDTLSGLTAIDGTGGLGTHSSGTVAWTLIPATNAAPTEPTRYTVGGEISFMQDGKLFRIQLYPAPITVLPDPRLILDYFWERTAYADDPLTPAKEPTVPFAVGMIMRNEGLGTARALQIESAQPRIIDNASGLLIQFLLESAETNGQPVIPPDLTIELGDLDPSRTVQAIWWMNSSLLADFIDYKATFTHRNDLGQKNLSLIDSVSSRPLLHVVRADVPWDDGISDFLVSEGYPTNVLPESLYFSDGPVAPVAAITNGVMHGTPGPATTNVQLTADMPAGWVYVRVHDPAPTSVVLSSVQRSDGRSLMVRSNVWSTHRNFYPVGGIPYREDWLHLLDYITNAGPQSYTLGYNIAPEPPVIISQPLSVTNLVGSNAVFSVVATGTEPLSYRWFHSGDLDLRSTGPDLYISGITTSDAGTYYVEVSNAANRPTNSTAAYLKVLVPPVICPVTNYVVPVGTYLVITNCAEDLDQPITFNLGTNAPAGAAMTTNGLFTWTPTCAQGSRTYPITVWATDSGEPPASNSITFTVTVPECIEASLGHTVMQAGTTNSVSIYLLSTTALTNMGFTVVYPPERFTTNFTLVVNSPQVLTQSLEVIDAGQVQVGFTLPADTVLYGPTAVGELGFTAVPGQSSAFVPLQVRDVTGLKPDGTNVANAYGYPGRVVVIGPEPLLEAWLSGQTNVALRLYGNPGSNYLMSWTTNLPPTTWTPGWWSDPLTNLWETWEIPPTEPQLYFRAE